MSGIGNGIVHAVSDLQAIEGRGTCRIRIPLSIPVNHNRISLLQASIPRSYYILNDAIAGDGIQNNVYYVAEVTGGVAGAWTAFTVTRGNWSASQLATAITGAVSDTQDQKTLAELYPTFTPTFSNDIEEPISRMLFDYTTANPTPPNLVFRMSPMLGRILGFDIGPSYGAANLTENGTMWSDASGGIYFYIEPGARVSAPGCVNVNYSNALWIQTELAADDSLSNFGNVLSHVYVNHSVWNTFVTFINPTPRESSKRLVTHDEGDANIPTQSAKRVHKAFEFWITDDDGTIVDLNGLHWDIVVLTWREEPLFELQRRFSLAVMEIAQEFRHK